jgi:hypothetical protein
MSKNSHKQRNLCFLTALKDLNPNGYDWLNHLKGKMMNAQNQDPPVGRRIDLVLPDGTPVYYNADELNRINNFKNQL